MTSGMRDGAAWTAFLLMCFAVVGLSGLFASYATSIPLERALARGAALDQALLAARLPDAPARIEALRPALGSSADTILSGPGDVVDRVVAARATVLAEGEREARSVAHRVRIMVGIVSLLAAGLGAGIMALARKARVDNGRPGMR